MDNTHARPQIVAGTRTTQGYCRTRKHIYLMPLPRQLAAQVTQVNVHATRFLAPA